VDALILRLAMRFGLVGVAWVVVGAVGVRAGGPSSLRDYIARVLKWNPASNGPLMALDVDQTYRLNDAPDQLSSYHVKKVKVGDITVLAADQTLVFEDSDLPGPYDSLSNEEKIKFLLATLSPGEIQKLNGAGICADDLRGEPRAALLSLLPKPLRFFSGTVSGINATESTGGPEVLPSNLLPKVRLQLHKGLHIGSHAMSTGPSSRSYNVSSSLSYRGPIGTPIAFSAGSLLPFPMAGSASGRVEPTAEKKSALAWTDARLAGNIALLPKTTIDEAIDRIRAQTGIEIYAEAGVAPVQLFAFGTSAKAADVLRGIVVLVGGALRQVGPAYVLAPNMEGQGAKEARLQARRYLEGLQIRERRKEWNEAVERSGILQKLSFSRQDAFGAVPLPSAAFATDSRLPDSDWISLDKLPPQIRAFVETQSIPETNSEQKPIESLRDKVRLSTTIGYRFVLPDGRTLEYKEFDSTVVPTRTPTSNGNKLPLDFSKLLPGSAVGIRGNDAAVVAEQCAKLKEFHVPEIWLRSTSSEAIKAAIDSGLKVDLVVNPWRILPGESYDELDRDIMALTGASLEKIPAAKISSMSRQTRIFGDSFSPADPGISNHLNRILELIPRKGLNRIIVEDREPDGYEAPSPGGQTMGIVMTADGPVLPGLPESAPGIIDFGYTARLRVAFLRKYRMDPVDLLRDNYVPLLPPAPYFEARPMFNWESYSFPPSPLQDRFPAQRWAEFRHELFKTIEAKLDAELAKFQIPVLANQPKGLDFASAGFISFVETAANIKPEDKHYVRCITVNPLTAEDAEGHFNYTMIPGYLGVICFDLSEVPPSRFNVYLRYLVHAGN